MERIEIRVDGMTCGGSVKSIQNALTHRDGIHLRQLTWTVQR